MTNEFQERLLKMIAERRITASELSERSGVGKSDISNYVNGKYVGKQDKVYALAKALGCDPGWLMTGEEPLSFDADSMNNEEKRIVKAYRLADSGTKSAVRKLLDVLDDKQIEDLISGE